MQENFVNPPAVVNGKRLNQQRLAAGFDLVLVAKMTCLSVAQVRQLEEGEHSLFYNPAVRLKAACKVASALGVPAESILDIPLIPVVTEAAAPEISAIDKTTIEIPLPVTALRAGYPKRRGMTRVSAIVLCLLFGLGGVAATLLSGKTLSFQTIQKTLPPPPAAIEGLKPDANKGVKNSVKTSVEACPAAEEDFQTLQPAHAVKDGSSVYVEGAVGQTVCVRDANGRAWQHVFTATVNYTFNGHAPWVLQSHDLSKMRVFFQGQLVRVPASAGTGIRLAEKAFP